MKRRKTVKLPIGVSMMVCTHLAQPVKNWATVSVPHMRSFAENASGKWIYVDNHPVREFKGLVKDGQNYVHVESFIPLGYEVFVSGRKTKISGANDLTIDNSTLNFEMNSTRISIESVQVDGEVYVRIDDFINLTGAEATLKDGSLWVSKPKTAIRLSVAGKKSHIFRFSMDGRELLVPKFVIPIALPSFSLRGDKLKSMVSGVCVPIAKFETDGLCRLRQLVETVGGRSTVGDDAGGCVLTVEHDDDSFVNQQREELNAARMGRLTSSLGELLHGTASLKSYA